MLHKMCYGLILMIIGAINIMVGLRYIENTSRYNYKDIIAYINLTIGFIDLIYPFFLFGVV